MIAYLNSNLRIPNSNLLKLHHAEVNKNLIRNNAGGKRSILILLDLSAAFDTVDHQTLLFDLENIGKTHLTDRNFKVIWNDKESELGSMKFEVPQGTILGPVLFIIYSTG